MDEGKLVPDDLMISLVVEEATPNLEVGKSLLLDGFPRNVTQAEALEKVVHVDLVVNLDIPTDTIVERIADRYGPTLFWAWFEWLLFVWLNTQSSSLFKKFRWIHPASGRIYSYSYKPPKVEGKDDITGEPLVQRPDDDPEKVRIRLQAYDEVRIAMFWDTHDCWYWKN